MEKLMTTLFSVFAPVLLVSGLKFSLIGLILISMFSVAIIFITLEKITSYSYIKSMTNLFPTSSGSVSFMLSLFLSLMLLNLVSMTVYSYPVTTTLGFNLSAAVSCWVSGILLQANKITLNSAVLPSNSPWYLVPFLCLVEVVSIFVRPITLCFRLLANMTAGHVLLALICKMNYFWALGSIFGTLELAVAVVQAFVFSMLISVYLEEAMTH